MQVNTLIIGAGRSGTTTLYKLLESHKQVCFSTIKEVHYFSIDELYQRGTSYYHSFFPKYQHQSIVASADTYLMIDYHAISRIKAYNPSMKIIVMLRDPVQRAYSSYNYAINYGYHGAYTTFTDSIIQEQNLAQEPSIIQKNNVGHFYTGLYATHLQKWEEVFPRDQFLLLTTRDLNSKSEDLQNKLTQFLGIEPFVGNPIKGEKQNPNALPKNKTFEQFLLNRDNPLRKLIRNITPQFIKRAIINSSLVDKLHDINRIPTSYTPLSDSQYQQALNYFKADLKTLENQYGIYF